MFRHSACQLARLSVKIEEENAIHQQTFGLVAINRSLRSPQRVFLSSNEPKNASHLISDKFKSTNKDWYEFIRVGILQDMKSYSVLSSACLRDYKDLIDPKYKGLIWSSNYNTAGTRKS